MYCAAVQDEQDIAKMHVPAHNEMYCAAVQCEQDIAKMENKIMQMFRLRAGRCEALRTASYAQFRCEILRVLRHGPENASYVCLSCPIAGGLMAYFECEKGECVVSLRWDKCVFPNDMESKRLNPCPEK